MTARFMKKSNGQHENRKDRYINKEIVNRQVELECSTMNQTGMSEKQIEEQKKVVLFLFRRNM